VSSLNAPVGTSGDETTELGDQIVDDGTVDAHAAVETGIGIDAVRNYGLGCLPPRELYVMTRVWGLDGEPADSLSTIGDVLGVTREAARQTHNRAMSRLTHPHTLRKIMQARHGELAGV
jgi:DNA-directed RNA polymerase sigma subunit (sigma70/sigma32)